MCGSRISENMQQKNVSIVPSCTVLSALTPDGNPGSTTAAGSSFEEEATPIHSSSIGSEFSGGHSATETSSGGNSGGGKGGGSSHLLAPAGKNHGRYVKKCVSRMAQTNHAPGGAASNNASFRSFMA